MSNCPGFYYYQRPVSCSACIGTAEMFGDDPNCKRCYETNRVKVKLLQFSGRLFRHDAIIQHLNTGKVEAVPIRYLTYGGESDD